MFWAHDKPSNGPRETSKRAQSRAMPSLVLVVWALAASCGGGQDAGSAAPPVTTAPPVTQAATPITTAPPVTQAVTPSAGVSVVAQAKVPSVKVFAKPENTAEPTNTLTHPTKSGSPLVLLVQKRQSEWLLVDLPVLPNGSTGWVQAIDVTVSQHNYRIVVELNAHTITALKGTDTVLSEPVGVGVGTCATSGGNFYTTELLQPPKPDSVYGAYAYGLSGSPDDSAPFEGNIPRLGIQGNNDPSVLGKDVTKGCILMSNSGITTLAKMLPLGVPVEIRK